MRVLLVSFVGNNRWSGMGKWSHRVAEGLRLHGHSPTLWFADDFPRSARMGRLAVLAFPLALLARLVRSRHRFDVVLIHEPSGFWYGLLRKAWRSLPPMVAVCHNVESKHFGVLRAAAERGLAHVPRGMRVKTPLFRLWQADGTIRLADHVLCLSNEDREYIVGRLGRDGADVTRVINGVSEEDFRERGDRIAGKRVLFVGGWLDVKGRHLLPELWKRVRAAMPDARLTLVGTGVEEEVVLDAFAPGERASITVIPRITTPAAMTEQFVMHDVFLMPSLSEGSPLSLLEALAVGIPVVAARVGGIPDIVRHGEEGLLFGPMDAADGADQLVRLLSDPAMGRTLAGAGQQRARELSWLGAARVVERVLRTVR